MKLLTFVSLFLTGCASFDVQWTQDLPGYRMQSMQWTVLQGTRAVADRCGLDVPRTACVIRIREGGQCLVYSIYTEDQAKRYRAIEGGSIHEHELEHCGIRKGVNIGGGWTHPGAGND
jgi:hypothetical protein